MFKNKALLLFSCLAIILFFSRVTFAQQEESSEVLNLVDQEQSNTFSSSSQTNQSQASTFKGVTLNSQVIANQSIKDNELNLNELRAIFSLRARIWPDGTPITVFVLRDDHEVHRQFLLKTLKMLPHQLRRQWDRFIYSGIGQGPTVVESQEEMLIKVKATPGGIGYLERGVTDGSVHMLFVH